MFITAVCFIFLMVYRGLNSYRERVSVITLFPNIFSYCSCMLSEFVKAWTIEETRRFIIHGKSFWKESLTCTSSLFAARALSSPNRMWFSVALVKFHWLEINWHVFNQSECRNCCLLSPQGFGPEAKTRGAIIVFPAYMYKKWVKYWCSMRINSPFHG